jgi:hypothetical protein
MSKIRLFISALLLVCALGGHAQHSAADTTGISFSDLSFEQALKKAAEENKIVFIDCYTQSCGPCKMMARKVFPQKVCGDYFNSRFVSLIRDMEAGEGPELGARYEVRIYPTFLFINPDGSVLLHYNLGAEPNAEKFVAKIDNALQIAKMKTVFDSGEYTDSFLDEYLSRAKNYDNTYFQKALAQAYAGAPLQQIARPAVWQHITDGLNKTDNALFRRMIDNRKALSEILPDGEPYNYLLNILAQDFRVRKNMNYDYPARIADIRKLEDDGCENARSLRMQVMFYDIIAHGLTDRLGEISAELASVPEEIGNPAQRAEVLNSLSRIDIILPPDGAEREKFVKALDSVRETLPEDLRTRTDAVFARIGL